MPVYIGILMRGIVAKNLILLIDFAIEEMGRGVEKVHAIIDAGRKRAQPIVMTTVVKVQSRCKRPAGGHMGCDKECCTPQLPDSRRA
jgi:hypothetical protein